MTINDEQRRLEARTREAMQEAWEEAREAWKAWRKAWEAREEQAAKSHQQEQS